MFACAIYLCALIVSASVFAYPVDIFDQKTKIFTFDKKHCTDNDICDLVQVEFREYIFRLPPDDPYDPNDSPMYGSELYAAYRTTNVGSLEKYGFVQYIRGCVFDSLIENGREVNLPRIRMFLGKKIPFKHAEQVVDSLDTDPLYNSSKPETGTRHGGYRWNKIPGSFAPHKQPQHIFYSELKPPYPELYVTDIPSYAHALYGTPLIVSLELRMCLYKTADIPIAMYGSIIVAPPLACYSWNHRVAYNHETKTFQRLGSMHPVCLE